MAFFKKLQKLDEEKARKTINLNTRLNGTYIILLVCSSIISTLGLLLNSIPIVIGGMIIAPLMWPLLKTSFGVTYGRKVEVLKGSGVLILSILIAVITALLITQLSPIKVVNEEILARTNPTFLDLIIAMASGVVAAVALFKPRVSQNLAGVAVATALMPPICVTGIGIALKDQDVFMGSFLLFVTNVVAIIFVTVLILAILDLNKKERHELSFKGISLVTLAVVLTSVPLLYYLTTYSFKAGVYGKTESVLQNNLKEISSDIDISNIKVDYGHRNDKVNIKAQIELPEGVKINYKHQQELIEALEENFGKKVDLNLTLLKTISIATADDIEFSDKKNLLEKALVQDIEREMPSAFIENIEISLDQEKTEWKIYTTIYADPGTVFTYTQREKLQNNLAEIVEEAVSLDIDIILLTSLKQEENETIQNIKKDVQIAFNNLSDDVEVSAINLKETGTDSLDVEIELKAPYIFVLEQVKIFNLKEGLLDTYGKNVSFKVLTIIRDVDEF